MSEEKQQVKKKIKFSVNTHYDEKLVGPGTEFETMEVDEFWADYFIENNAATAVVEPKTAVQTNQGGQPPKQQS